MQITKYKQAPRVFISSTVSGADSKDLGLKSYREKIHRMITTEFEWECVCSGESDQYFWGSNLSACLNAVKYTDLYIGIFWKRYGEPVVPLGLPMTELEFYTAMNSGRPMRIYVIDADYRERHLQLFIDWLKGEQYLCFCKLHELKERIRRDLEEFGRRWPSKELIAEFVPPFYLSEIMSKLKLLPLELPFLTEELECKRFDKEFVLEKLENMRIRQSSHQYVEMLKEGWDVINMLRLRPPHKYREFRNLWAEFLRFWEDACGWYGYIEGTFGSLSASKALRDIYRLLEAWPLYDSAASIISSSLYTLSTLKESKASFIENAGWRKELQTQARKILDQSLTYIQFPFYRSSKISSTVWSIRGNIYRQRGNFEEAVRSHLKAIGTCTSKEEYGMQLSHLGRAKILKGNREAIKDLEQGARICGKLDTPSAARAIKALGQGLVVLEEWDRADEEIRKALRLAKKMELGHQIETIKATLNRIREERAVNIN